MNYSRIFLVVFVAVVVALLFLERALLALGWKFAYRKWTRPIRVLLVGSGDLMDMYVRKLHSVQPYPIRWVGRVGEKRSPVLDSWIPFLGDESRLSNVIEKESIDQVVVSYAPEVNAKYPSVLDSLSKEVVSVKVLPNFGRESSFTYHATDECGFPLLMFNQPPASVTDRFFKRAFDLFGAFVLLILFSPLLLLIALLIKLTSKGPAIYSQLRIGADGKEFIFYKFRSMKIEAEEETGPVWATKNDTRTTRLGQFLRRTSLDELPQLYNVLIGDMSLVGPRPERPVFVKQFRENIPKYMLRHRMKSGMTGWAQINGWRGDTSIEERIKHDLYYIGHWSHYFDIKILVLTAFKGFIHRNAY